MKPRRVSIATCRDTPVSYPAFLTRSPGGQTNGCATHIPARSLPAKPLHVERDAKTRELGPFKDKGSVRVRKRNFNAYSASRRAISTGSSNGRCGTCAEDSD